LVDSSEDEAESLDAKLLANQEDDVERPRAAAAPQAWADLVDSPRVTTGPRAWADLVDSSDEAASKDTKKAADLSESTEDQESRSSLGASGASTDLTHTSGDSSARSSRASRRTRAARAAAVAEASCAATADEGTAWQPATRKRETPAAEIDSSKWSQVATSGKGTGKAADKGASKGVAKGTGKGAGKVGSKGTGKGDSRGKGADNVDSKTAGKGKGASKGSSKGGAKGTAQKGGGKGHEKYQCQLTVGIEEDSKFRVVRRLIGSGGENMKNINQKSDAKLRLRGRGSKFLEGDDQQESTDDLMLCISSQDKAGFETAKAMASELIEGIHHSYRAFCHKAGKECPVLGLRISEGYREGSR
jgi:hypothetical protein